MSAMVDIECDLLQSLDFDHTFPCEGEQHSVNGFGHNSEEPARWVLSVPCCGPKLLICESRRKYILSDSEIYCAIHRRTHLTVECRFIPIE